MKPTDDNITGVEEFDHSPLKALPEYLAASEALDALVHRMRDDGIKFGQERFLKLAEQLAASLSYADATGHDRDSQCERRHKATWPYRTVMEKPDWVLGYYHCPSCGQDWTCGYSVNISAWL
jgi:hypothetical protein